MLLSSISTQRRSSIKFKRIWRIAKCRAKKNTN